MGDLIYLTREEAEDKFVQTRVRSAAASARHMLAAMDDDELEDVLDGPDGDKTHLIEYDFLEGK